MRRPTQSAIDCLVLAACLLMAAPTELLNAQVSANHPRLLLTPADVEALSALRDAGDPRTTEILEEADALAEDGTLEAGYQGVGWAEEVPVVGLAYLLTHDARYAAPALAMLDEVNTQRAAGDVSAIGVDSTYASRSTGFAVGLAFDWFHDALGDTRRAATVATINAYFDHFLTAERVYERDGPGYGNYFGGHLLGYGAMGYASHGDNARADEIIAAISERFEREVRPAFDAGAFEGGAPVEGYTYGGNHFVRLFQYMSIVRSATGAAPTGASGWAAEILVTLIHALKPNRWQLCDEGDYTGDFAGLLSLNQLFAIAATTEDSAAAGYSAYLIDHPGNPPMGDVGSPGALARLLAPSIEVTPLDYREFLPTYHHAAGAALAYMRTSWEDDAVWASFNANFERWTGHVGRQTGHFTVQRGDDYLLVTGHQFKQQRIFEDGTLVGYEGTGYTGNTYIGPNSSWTNTLFADDGVGGYLYDDETYEGGQLGFATNQPYEISQSADHTYVKVDATEAYVASSPGDFSERSVQAFVRSYMFTQSGAIFVYDRVRLLDADVRGELRFHFNASGVPTIEGDGLASSGVGASRLYLQSRSPSPIELALEWHALEAIDYLPRIAVRAVTPSTELDVLHTFYATAIDGGMPESNTIDAGAFTGTFLDVPGLARAVLFSSQLTARSDAAEVSFTVPERAAIRVIIADLSAGSFRVDVTAAADALSVTAARDAAGAFVVDEAGLLRFDLTDGRAEGTPEDPPLEMPPVTPRPDGGMDVVDPPAGGCACRASSAGSHPNAAWLLTALVVLGASLRSRRRRRAE